MLKADPPEGKQVLCLGEVNNPVGVGVGGVNDESVCVCTTVEIILTIATVEEVIPSFAEEFIDTIVTE